MSQPSLRVQFEALSELDAGAREEALEVLARSDPERARRLRVMLDADPANAPEQPLPSIAEVLSGSLLEQRRGAIAASGFVAQRLLGRGGMGEVWLVQRTIAGRKQSLALKLLQLGSGPADLWLARFRTEQRILLELDHPGIARLIDAGEAEGQPWIAMEYVDGADIVSWCDAHKLNLKSRLQLFQQVCAAVQYAHDRLIVHRDLKPANVLVNSQGEPKLLDFGIAKILDDPAGLRTGTAQQIFSLYGVSPEQLRGEAPTVATDVYALGALLYELVCGRQALDFESLSLSGIEQRLQHESPQLPSLGITETAAQARSAAAPQVLTRQLRGDLDRIVLHALRKQSHERYSSAREFSRDIQRLLDQQPVLAAGQGQAYRARKFLRRHRLGVGVVLIMVALVIGFIVQLQQERDAAARARDGAQRVSDFLVRMFELGDPTRSLAREISAAEMLEQGFRQLDEQQLDARTGAPVLLAMAQAANGLGDPKLVETALAALQRAESELDISQQIQLNTVALELAIAHIDDQLTESVFASLQALPRSEFSDAQRERMDLFEIQILRKRGKFTEALARLEAHPPWSPRLEIRALRQQALILSGLKRYSAIEALLAPVCERLRQEPMRALDLVALLRFRTLAAAKLQQHAQVAALLQEATERITKRLGPEHLLSLDLRAHSAVVYATIGQYPLAIEILTELLPVFAAKLKPDHSILSSAQINLVLIIAEYTGSTPAQLVLARKLAATLMTDPEAGVRARMHMALIQMNVIEGKLDEARAAVSAYLAKPPPELAGPARIAQLEGWALVLDEAASPTPTQIAGLQARQSVDDLQLRNRLLAAHEAALQRADRGRNPMLPR